MSTRSRKGKGTSNAEKRKAVGQEEGPQQKKQKASAAELPIQAFDILTPQDCPAWLANAIKLVAAFDFGAKWQSLVASWVKFEEASNYKSSRLGTKSRPQTIAKWIQLARKPDYRPDIENLAAYEADFKAWWISLQPPWRCRDGVDWPLKGSGDWDILRQSGQNGLLSVVAALFFWGWAARTATNDAEGAWSLAVDDVLYALTQLL